MRLKDGVDATNVHPALWLLLGTIAQRHRLITRSELVVTSLRRPPGPRPSLHSPGPAEPCRAADLRRHALDNQGLAERFARMLQHEYGSELGVVVEPEWLTDEEAAARGGRETVTPHIHVELKIAGWPSTL